MADDRRDDPAVDLDPNATDESAEVEAARTAAKEELLSSLTDKQREALLAGDSVEGLTEEEIRSRMVATDSGDTLGHDEVVQGLARELSAQSKVIDTLSEQREAPGVNIATVLDSSRVDLSRLITERDQEPTKNVIGPLASKERRLAIHNAINLPNGTAFQMCIKSIFTRLGRVMITGSGIFLGIAFFASVRMTSLALHASGEAVDDQARQVWLIVMALLVSVVGIANSMLMAVTERFREIGTMKCLGALDSFIVKLFLIESGLLGLLAGFFGGLIGLLLMYVVNILKYDFKFTDVVGGMAWTMVMAVLLGSILSILAAILPAQQAAKMPAAAALRSTV